MTTSKDAHLDKWEVSVWEESSLPPDAADNRIQAVNSGQEGPGYRVEPSSRDLWGDVWQQQPLPNVEGRRPIVEGKDIPDGPGFDPTTAAGYVWVKPAAPLEYAFTPKQSQALVTIKPKDEPKYKYDEDLIIKSFQEYIKQTYAQHYHAKDRESDLSAFDAWVALGSAKTTTRDTALKYLWRLGKKGDKEDELEDIFKVMHYCLFMYFLTLES